MQDDLKGLAERESAEPKTKDRRTIRIDYEVHWPMSEQIYTYRYFILLGLVLLVLGGALIAGQVDGEAFVAAVTALFTVFCGAGAWQSGKGKKP
jgi:uncharacterized membrane protein